MSSFFLSRSIGFNVQQMLVRQSSSHGSIIAPTTFRSTNCRSWQKHDPRETSANSFFPEGRSTQGQGCNYARSVRSYQKVSMAPRASYVGFLSLCLPPSLCSHEMVMSQPGSTSSRKPVHQDRRPRPIDLRNLHPLAPQPQPALPPRPRPGGTGSDVFWAKLTWIVQRWNRIDRFNGNKWTPLDWQNGWARVITPEWWRTQASDSKNLELVLETLNQDNPITDIHHPDFVRS